ncbi:MAG: DUF6503 family protein [Bacteroidota bacterium]
MMKNLLFLFILAVSLVACQDAATENTSTEDQAAAERVLPSAFTKVLEAHGGLEQWEKMQTLTFDRANSAGNEKIFVDLKSRHDKIEAPSFKMGYDGTQYWVEADTSFKRNPIFYHNLMFYFYAMPFVLADEGINYREVEPLVVDSVSYPGIAMTFNDGVGSSPKDDYIVYYNPDTYQMEWLGYTATYYSQEKSSKFSYIRYPKWQSFSGVNLPTELTWYHTEEGKVTEPRNNVMFENIQLAEMPYSEGTLAMPAGAKVFEE